MGVVPRTLHEGIVCFEYFHDDVSSPLNDHPKKAILVRRACDRGVCPKNLYSLDAAIYFLSIH